MPLQKVIFENKAMLQFANFNLIFLFSIGSQLFRERNRNTQLDQVRMMSKIFDIDLLIARVCLHMTLQFREKNLDTWRQKNHEKTRINRLADKCAGAFISIE